MYERTKCTNQVQLLSDKRCRLCVGDLIKAIGTRDHILRSLVLARCDFGNSTREKRGT